jgi:hypothetical protein
MTFRRIHSNKPRLTRFTPGLRAHRGILFSSARKLLGSIEPCLGPRWRKSVNWQTLRDFWMGYFSLARDRRELFHPPPGSAWKAQKHHVRILLKSAGAVDDFVTVGSSRFNTNQQFLIMSVQQVQYQSRESSHLPRKRQGAYNSCPARASVIRITYVGLNKLLKFVTASFCSEDKL